MAKRTRIVRATAEEIARRVAAGEDKTDWQRASAMSQDEVERLAEEEEGVLPEGWESTIELGIPESKLGVHIRLDPAVPCCGRLLKPAGVQRTARTNPYDRPRGSGDRRQNLHSPAGRFARRARSPGQINA